MTSPSFIDANIPVYSGGKAHPLKGPCTQILELVAAYPYAFVTDAEVLQELMHRYLAIHQWHTYGRELFSKFRELADGRIEAIYARDVELAAQLVDQYPRLSARDLIHLAVMRRLGITQIVTADKAFDALPDVQRLDPLDLPSWQAQVLEGNR